jgi:8-oxo-dGTP diphosphatase
MLGLAMSGILEIRAEPREQDEPGTEDRQERGDGEKGVADRAAPHASGDWSRNAMSAACPFAEETRRGGEESAGPSARSATIDAVSEEPLQVVAAAIVQDRRVLLVSKRAAPDVFFLPGGKPEPGEEAAATLARELEEELGVALVASTPLATVSDEAALERGPMEMAVHLAVVEGQPEPRAEIVALAWAGSDHASRAKVAPAVRNNVLPQLAARDIID